MDTYSYLILLMLFIVCTSDYVSVNASLRSPHKLLVFNNNIIILWVKVITQTLDLLFKTALLVRTSSADTRHFVHLGDSASF